MAIKKDERSRNWTFILYPDSAVEHWRTVLDDLHIQWIESPLHEADINGDGSQKKPHWHIILLFEGNKSYEQIKEITDSVKGTVPFKVASIRSTVRYLAHLDNPDKHQYSITDIIAHGGADVADYLRATTSSRYQMIDEMTRFIDDNNITEYRDLVRYARQNEPDWFYLLCDSATYFISAYIKSCRHRVIAVDKETGEVIEKF